MQCPGVNTTLPLACTHWTSTGPEPVCDGDWEVSGLQRGGVTWDGVGWGWGERWVGGEVGKLGSGRLGGKKRGGSEEKWGSGLLGSRVVVLCTSVGIVLLDIRQAILHAVNLLHHSVCGLQQRLQHLRPGSAPLCPPALHESIGEGGRDKLGGGIRRGGG